MWNRSVPPSVSADQKGARMPQLCPRGGRWTLAANHTPPYSAGRVGLPAPTFYKACHTRGDYRDWRWDAADPPCRAAAHGDSWCKALRGRSLLFVGDSLSLQMLWSLLHLVPADGSQLARARAMYDMDFKRGVARSACAAARGAPRSFATIGS